MEHELMQDDSLIPKLNASCRDEPIGLSCSGKIKFWWFGNLPMKLPN